MRRLGSQFWVALVCLVLGVGLVSQFRTYHTVANTEMSPADEAQVISDLVAGNAGLRQEVSDLQDQVAQYGQPDSPNGVEAMQKDLAQLSVATGGVPVRGPGVEVHVSGYMRTEELDDMVNELRNAGAEAIAVNGHRLSARSVFVSTPDGYVIEGAAIAPPFIFSALGQSSTIQTALLRKGGVVELLAASYPSLSIDVLQRTAIVLPTAVPAAGTYALAHSAS